jgi:hypothetical protein
MSHIYSKFITIGITHLKIEIIKLLISFIEPADMPPFWLGDKMVSPGFCLSAVVDFCVSCKALVERVTQLTHQLISQAFDKCFAFNW